MLNNAHVFDYDAPFSLTSDDLWIANEALKNHLTNIISQNIFLSLYMKTEPANWLHSTYPFENVDENKWTKMKNRAYYVHVKNLKQIDC